MSQVSCHHGSFYLCKQCAMTHDELLKKVDRDHELTTYLNSGLINGDITINTARQHWFQGNALRAVVELAGKDIEHDSYVWLDGYDYAMKQIIQAIEKELK